MMVMLSAQALPPLPYVRQIKTCTSALNKPCLISLRVPIFGHCRWSLCSRATPSTSTPYLATMFYPCPSTHFSPRLSRRKMPTVRHTPAFSHLCLAALPRLLQDVTWTCAPMQVPIFSPHVRQIPVCSLVSAGVSIAVLSIAFENMLKAVYYRPARVSYRLRLFHFQHHHHCYYILTILSFTSTLSSNFVARSIE